VTDPVEEDPAPAAMAAWGAFLRAHADLVRRMDHALRMATGMPLQWYDVLRNIAEPDEAPTMRQLEQRVLLSQSGLSRLVARLTDAGLVVRSTPADDRRSVVLALTPGGRERLRAAKTVMSRQVRELFARRMTADEAAVLLAVLRRMHSRDPEESEEPGPARS
jgi:DNA-binding MarR family transcriptional regulator